MHPCEWHADVPFEYRWCRLRAVRSLAVKLVVKSLSIVDSKLVGRLNHSQLTMHPPIAKSFCSELELPHKAYCNGWLDRFYWLL